ncbi:MAG: hypothetical protein HOW73_20325 [Polyangiaceae bacterium]|nr:hypothetical protein [Polyangiaceae bacterium]
MAWLDLSAEIAEEMSSLCSTRPDIRGLTVHAVRGDRDEELFNRKFRRTVERGLREQAKPQLRLPGVR